MSLPNNLSNQATFILKMQAHLSSKTSPAGLKVIAKKKAPKSEDSSEKSLCGNWAQMPVELKFHWEEKSRDYGQGFRVRLYLHFGTQLVEGM